MNKKYHLFLLIILQSFCAFSQSSKGYQYRVDLTNVKDDRILVELTTPKIKEKEIIFNLPKIIPGTYAIADYGRFVEDLQAFDKKGNPIALERLNDNSWKILNAEKLARISYWVNDSYDNPPAGPAIYPMAGTNIEDGKNFVLNGAGFFGYLDGIKEVPFSVQIIRPETFYGSTGLIPKSMGNPVPQLNKENKTDGISRKQDVYTVENYDRLIDSPIMYSKADTAIIHVGNAEVLIASYAPNNKITGKEIAATVKDVLMAQKDYLGGNLPVDKYAFIFYFTDQPVNGYGALEHSYSSFYYMPERTLADMNQQLRDFAAHEFFHIITPLTIHSKEIQTFDFNDPKMSRHLWLYEGVTEYFAGNVQVWYKLITPEQYLEVLRGKMIASTSFYQDDLPFTELSLKTLAEHKNEYGNVYQKGALIGMCLDILLRKNTEGKYGLRDLIADLSKKYGKNNAFDDGALFDQITAMTYPEIGEFFKKYVEGPEKLPLNDILQIVGVTYIPEESYRDVNIGMENRALNYMKVPERDNKLFIVITNPDALNDQGKALNFKAGDMLVSINNEPLPSSGILAFFTKQKEQLQVGKTLTYRVLRKDDAGNFSEVELSAPVIEIDRTRRHLLQFDPNPSATQLTIRKAWLNE